MLHTKSCANTRFYFLPDHASRLTFASARPSLSDSYAQLEVIKMSTAAPFQILTDQKWLADAPAPTHNEDLATRIDKAVRLYNPGNCNESTTKAISAFAKLGIVALSSTSDQPLATYIANSLLNGSQSPASAEENGTDGAYNFMLSITNGTPIRIPCRSTLILSHICECLSITIRLFSTRAKTRVFGSAPTAHGLAFLHCVDSFHRTSQYLIVGLSRQVSSPLSLMPAPPPVMPSAVPPAALPHDRPVVRAVYRDGPRSKKQRRDNFSLEQDGCKQAMQETRYI